MGTSLHVSKGDDSWNHVVYSDEKRIFLDGPDGLRYYWHGIRSEPPRFRKRVQTGTAVKYWGAIYLYRASTVVQINVSMNFQLYCHVLRIRLIPWTSVPFGEDSTSFNRITRLVMYQNLRAPFFWRRLFPCYIGIPSPTTSM